MRIKTYRAETVADAMAQVREELGTEALILATRRTASGMEVTAGLEQSEYSAAPPLPRDPASARPRPLLAQRVRPWRPKQLDPALAWHGVPAALASRLAGPDLSAALAKVFAFAPLPLADGAPVLLTGAPGAGKTLTTARLATRLVLGGLAPRIVSADGRRAGAAEELAAYTRLLGLELVVANRPSTLARALAIPSSGPVLIDTAGLNPFDPAQMQDVMALAAEARATAILVMAAGGDAEDAAEQAELFAAAGVRHLLPTRLDISRRLGAVLAAADAGTLTLTEAGTGPGATDGLTQLDPDFLAGRLRQTPSLNPNRPNRDARSHAV